MFSFESNQIYYTIGSGSGSASNKLNAFDRALIAAGNANYNLVKISSILPAGAHFTSEIKCKEGSMLPVAIASQICEPTENKITAAAAIAIGIPDNKERTGIIMEWSGISTEATAREKVISMVNIGMQDRGISNYALKVSSVEKESSNFEYVCVLAYVALFS